MLSIRTAQYARGSFHWCAVTAVDAEERVSHTHDKMYQALCILLTVVSSAFLTQELTGGMYGSGTPRRSKPGSMHLLISMCLSRSLFKFKHHYPTEDMLLLMTLALESVELVRNSSKHHCWRWPSQATRDVHYLVTSSEKETLCSFVMEWGGANVLDNIV